MFEQLEQALYKGLVQVQYIHFDQDIDMVFCHFEKIQAIEVC